MKQLPRFVLAIGLVLLAPLAIAVPPQTINYQGYLTSPPPGSTPVNGPVVMTFKLYNAATLGTLLWTEVQSSVPVTNGTFNAVLGSVTPLTLGTVPFDVPYFLEITVGSAASAEILSPRQPLASSPYAFRAASLDSTGTIPASSLTGNIGPANLATTQVLPAVPCTTGQITKWNGSAWACAADDTVTVPISGGINGQVLVGTGGAPAWTDSPAINGNLVLANPSTASTGNIMKGGSAFIHNFGTQNTFIGISAGNFTMSGTNNTAIGLAALAANTTGDYNTASGVSALEHNTTGTGNTASGTGALAANTTGNFNTASGQSALQSNTLGNNNTASGVQALFFNQSGTDNTASGYRALFNNTSFTNTAIGSNALFNNTDGYENTASGAYALHDNASGRMNTANGVSALQSNTTGHYNTAAGGHALQSNVSGISNTAIGMSALTNNLTGDNNTGSGFETLYFNTIGHDNTANGYRALNSNTGHYNTASGASALLNNAGGNFNTASGQGSLASNLSGTQNTANGAGALYSNTTGDNNTAVGFQALNGNGAGGNNIAIGFNAGHLTTGSDTIAIGNDGVAGESGTIRIGGGNQTLTYISGIYGAPDLTTGTAVYIRNNGRLGTNPSSRRYKDDIADMDAASSALMQLRPVTFHYKTDQNPAGRTLQYGLIAEEVNEIYPGLVVHSADGQIDGVAYQHLPPMLLNEFQKQQRTIAAQAVDIQRQAAELTQQRTRVELLERELQAIKAMLGGR